MEPAAPKLQSGSTWILLRPQLSRSSSIAEPLTPSSFSFVCGASQRLGRSWEHVTFLSCPFVFCLSCLLALLSFCLFSLSLLFITTFTKGVCLCRSRKHHASFLSVLFSSLLLFLSFLTGQGPQRVDNEVWVLFWLVPFHPVPVFFSCPACLHVLSSFH